MTGFLKLALIAVFGALAAVCVKKNNPDIAIALTVAAGVTVLFFLSDAFTTIAEFMRHLADMAHIPSEHFGPLIKSVAIAVVARLAADVCRDAGQAALSSAVDLGGVVIALYLSLPLMSDVLDMVSGVL